MASSPNEIPIRLRNEGRSATWNPASSRAVQVLVHVRCEDGEVQIRRSVNSGRVKVRDTETIERVVAAEG